MLARRVLFVLSFLFLVSYLVGVPAVESVSLRQKASLTITRVIPGHHRATVEWLKPETAPEYTGFQYVDWLFDGDDLIFVSRTAYNGAHNYHDANHLTFHRVKNFARGPRWVGP